MSNLVKKIFASCLLVAGGLLLTPNSLNSQETESNYYDSYQFEKKFKGYEIDWNDWNPWEFSNKRWRLMDDIGIKKNKSYIDKLLLATYPDGTKNYRIFLVFDGSFRSLTGTKEIDPSGDFGIKDKFRIKHGKRSMKVGDYEGLKMYDKLNPKKLERARDGNLVDEVTLSSASDLAISRKIPFPIGELYLYTNYDYETAQHYLEGPIWLYFGKDSTQIYNLDW